VTAFSDSEDIDWTQVDQDFDQEEANEIRAWHDDAIRQRLEFQMGFYEESPSGGSEYEMAPDDWAVEADDSDY
jgi:hypothetical protein